MHSLNKPATFSDCCIVPFNRVGKLGVIGPACGIPPSAFAHLSFINSSMLKSILLVLSKSMTKPGSPALDTGSTCLLACMPSRSVKSVTDEPMLVLCCV